MTDSKAGCYSTTKSHCRSAQRVARDRQTHLSRRSSSVLTRDVRSSSSGCQIVPMMRTAEPGHRNNPATHIGLPNCLATGRCSLCQCKVSPILVVITKVLVHEPLQMPFIENDHMVEQIPAAVANPASSNTVLAGGSGPTTPQRMGAPPLEIRGTFCLWLSEVPEIWANRQTLLVTFSCCPGTYMMRNANDPENVTKH